MERVERLKTLRAAVAGAEVEHAEAQELARTKLLLADAWECYLAAQNRPDSGESTLRQYRFHSFRHNTVTRMQEAGVPQAVVQEIVGHRTVVMTQRHTQIGRDALQKAVAALPAAVPTAQPALPAAPTDSEQDDRDKLHRFADSLSIAAVRRILALIAGLATTPT